MFSSIRRNLRLILVGATIGAVMVGSYASVLILSPPSNLPRAVWAVDQLVITFTATDTVTSGRATAMVACTPDAGYIQLLPWESNPAKLKLSTMPTGLSCGSAPSSIVVIAVCIVSAGDCRGSFTGRVHPRQVGVYRDLAGVLRVLVNVT